MLLSPQQRQIMDRAANRLLMSFPFGTGKSFLLHEKCAKLLKEGEKALFVLSYGGWDVRRYGSEVSQSFLLEKLKDLFAAFIDDGKLSSKAAQLSSWNAKLLIAGCVIWHSGKEKREKETQGSAE